MRLLILLGALWVLTGGVAAQDDSVFVTAELDRSRAFVGEQVIYTVTAYTDAARDVVFLPPDFDGFWQGTVRSFRGSATLNGKQYEAAIFQVSLFPLRDGMLTIGRPRAQFTDVGGGNAVIASGELVAVEAVPVPPSEDGFSGVVGTVIAQLRVEPETIRLGEAVRISLRLVGSANLEAGPWPGVLVPQSWRVYEDVSDTTGSFDGALATQDITLRWMAIPDEAGTAQVGVAPFMTFDPRTGFVDVTVPALRVDVLAAPDGSIRRDTTVSAPDEALHLVNDTPVTSAPPWLMWVVGPVLLITAVTLPSARVHVAAWRRRRRAERAAARFALGVQRVREAGQIGALGDLVRRYLADVGVRDVQSNSAAVAVLTDLEGMTYAPDSAAVMRRAVDRAQSFVKAVEERRSAMAR